MIAIIDYDAGNTRSVEAALTFLGEPSVITQDPGTILAADRVILPGVGSFGDAMGKLHHRGLVAVIRDCVSREIPFLGICLGLQLLFEGSEESPGVEGLHILKGRIRRIPAEGGLKVPHVGWNSLHFPGKGRLFQNLSGEPYVYFVHSYYLEAQEDVVTATTDYGVKIHASVEKGNLFACQFHPEKSAGVGMQILRNFIKIPRCEGHADYPKPER